jgi:hypothetical protein
LEEHIIEDFLGCLFNDAVSLRLYSNDDVMINECGAVGGMRIGRGNRSKRAPHYIRLKKMRLHFNAIN